ncbi:MAG: cache domain-containing protein [Colwellia sp.]
MQSFLRIILIILIIFSSWVIYACYKQNQQLAQFSDDYIWQLNTSIKEATRNFLLPAKNIVKLGASFYQQQLISLEKPKTLASFVQPFIKSYPQFNGYFVGSEQKEFWFWHNTYAPTYTYRIQTIYSNENKRLIEQKTFLDAEQKSLRLSKPLLAEYDPTTRLWYKGAKALGSGFWSDVYSFNSDLEHVIPGITASSPIYDQQHNLIGVWGVDIVLEELSNFLFDIGSSRATDLVIFNEQEKVIAYSAFNDITLKGELISLNDLEKPAVKAALKSYKKHGFSEFYFTQDGVRYLASYSSFLFGEEQDWSLLVVVPEGELVGDMTRNFELIALFSLLTLIISLLRLIFLSRQQVSRLIELLVNKSTSR